MAGKKKKPDDLFGGALDGGVEPEEGGDDVGGFRPRTVNGYPMDEVASALQKAIRRGREEAALFWGYEMYLVVPSVPSGAGCLIIASEDCAGDPMTAMVIGQLAQNALLASKNFTGRVEGMIETHALLIAVRSLKSREPCHAWGVVRRAKSGGLHPEPEPEAVDQHTMRGRNMGKNVKDFMNEGRLLGGKLGRDDWEKRRWLTKQKQQTFEDLTLPEVTDPTAKVPE